MKKIIYILVLTLFPLISFAQNLEWANKIGGSNDDRCYDITHDNSGNIYLTGGFCNSLNFNPLGTSFYLNSSNTDNSDVFVAKYDSDFNLIWALSIGNNEWEIGLSIEIDSSNNVYVTGNYKGNVDFDPSTSNYFLNSLNMSYFLAKYNSEGQLKWAKDIGSDGNNYLTVPSRTRLFIGDNENVFSFLHINDTLKSFNISGNLLWQKKISGLPILLDRSRFAYIKNFKTPFEYEYFYQDTVILCLFDIDDSKHNSYKIAQTNDGFIGGFINEGHNNEILVCGKFWGSISFYSISDTITISNYDSTMSSPGYYGPLAKEFIAKIDTSGNTIWVKDDIEINPYPYILKTNSLGDIFTVQTGLIAKYDSNFSFLAYSTFLGGSGNDFIGGMELYSDTAIICGHFFNTIDVDLTNNYYSLTASPPEDIFVAKYSNFDITNNPVSIKGMTNKMKQIEVYPNPSSGIFRVTFNRFVNNPLIVLYDIYGRKLMTEQIDRDNYTLDISRYKNGIYLLTILQEEEKISIKLVKQD